MGICFVIPASLATTVHRCWRAAPGAMHAPLDRGKRLDFHDHTGITTHGQLKSQSIYTDIALDQSRTLPWLKECITSM